MIAPLLIGLVGTPYCGSTIVGAILEALYQGTIAVGEVERLVRWQEPNSGQSEIPPCRRCQDACPVWTPSARVKLNEDTEVYPHLYRMFPEATALILSVKYPEFYDRLGRPDRAILLFRHPQAMAWSTLHHEGTAPEAYYPVWVDRYRYCLEWSERCDEKAVLSYRHFLSSPPVAGLTAGWRQDHQLSGNRGQLALSSAPPQYDDRWAHADIAPPSREALELYEELNARSVYC